MLPYHTDERLKSYLDTNQLHREQMCRAVLATDKRFTDVTPRHPRGGPDGGRDMQAIFRDNQKAFGAVGFINQANDSEEQKRKIERKFTDDLESAIEAADNLKVFVFFTNINLTIGEKDALISESKKKGVLACEIFDRERIRISLDSPDGFFIRFQFLNIALSESEQASFFSRWGDDIQSVISSGFQKIESTLNRILFLQESNDPITNLTISFELDKKYSADEIGHFRAFCYLTLKEPKHKIMSILFGSSDKSARMREDQKSDLALQKNGIKFGVATGQWEQHIDLDGKKDWNTEDDENEKWEKAGFGSAIGMQEIEFLPISYSKSSFIRFFPVIRLRDLDDAMFLPFMNKSLAEKIKAIHIYSSGYKLHEMPRSEFSIDTDEVDPKIPVVFNDAELEDPWVSIRPNLSTTFHMRFFEHTPKRLFLSSQVENSLEKKV